MRNGYCIFRTNAKAVVTQWRTNPITRIMIATEYFDKHLVKPDNYPLQNNLDPGETITSSSQQFWHVNNALKWKCRDLNRVSISSITVQHQTWKNSQWAGKFALCSVLILPSSFWLGFAPTAWTFSYCQDIQK